MIWLLVVAIVVIVLFGFVLLFGAPYIPTLKSQIVIALDLLDLKTGQTLLELGSGDGRVLKAAARRGIRSIGYEINPLLVLVSRLVTWRQRKLVTIYWRNFWRASLPPTDGVYVFLLNAYMQKLENKLTQECQQQTKVVSFAFAFPGRRIDKRKSGVMLYMFGATTRHR